MENLAKVQAKLTELNREAKNAALPAIIAGPWLAVQGFNFISAANPSTNTTFSIIPTSGYGIKLFINTRTGEIKMFPAASFL